MKPKSRPFLALVACLAILPFIFVQRQEAVQVSAASYTGLAQISGPIQLDLAVSPPVASPLDQLSINIRLANFTNSLASPKIFISLPSNIQVQTNQLPAGTTINLATNTLEWLAVVPGNSGFKELYIDAKILSADLSKPEQKISVTMQDGSSVETTSTTLWIGIPPKVEKITNSSIISIGQPLQLQVAAQGPGPLAEVWELGDGRRVAVNQPTIVFPAAGVYNVKVTVKNPIGSADYIAPITVIPHTAAQFRPQDDTPGIGEMVAFTNESGGQAPLQYTWDFGDGNTSAEKSPQHSFTTPGTYQVKLVSENAFGRSESSQSVTVGLPPNADIMVDNAAPAGELLTGEVISSDPSLQIAWEMGDGRQYDGQKISHAYRQSGDYYVTMTASNEFGSTKIGRWVHVDQGVLRMYLPLVSRFSGLPSGSSAESGDLIPVSQDQINLDVPFEMETMVFPPGTIPAHQLLLYINEARRQFDLSPLNEVSGLDAAAQKHTQDMASARHTRHIGSDGSSPAERLLWHGYTKGYAGEATAWGFQDPRQSVEFWVNSPSHRPIILNRYATEVGVGFTADYSAPSVWYWTAEFGNSYSAADAPTLRVEAPATGLEIYNTQLVTFRWNWSQPLSASEQFTLYLTGSSGSKAVGTVQTPINGTLFELTINPLEIKDLIGEFTWQIRLENNRSAVLSSGETRILTIYPDPSIPTSTPVPTITPTTAPTTAPTSTPMATVEPPTRTPRPTDQPPTGLVTATPLPTP